MAKTVLRAGGEDLEDSEARIDYDEDEGEYWLIVDGEPTAKTDRVTIHPLISDDVDLLTRNGARLTAMSIVDDLLIDGEDGETAGAISLDFVEAASITVSFAATQGAVPDDDWDALTAVAVNGEFTAELDFRH